MKQYNELMSEGLRGENFYYEATFDQYKQNALVTEFIHDIDDAKRKLIHNGYKATSGDKIWKHKKAGNHVVLYQADGGYRVKNSDQSGKDLK